MDQLCLIQLEGKLDIQAKDTPNGLFIMHQLHHLNFPRYNFLLRKIQAPASATRG